MKRLRIAIHERRALNCFVSGEYEEAGAHFRAIERISPEHPGLNHNLGLVAMALGDLEEAERRFTADLERLGDHYPRLRVLADLYYLWGKRDLALDFYRRASGDDPPAGSRRIIAERIAICEDADRFARAQEAAARYRAGNELEAVGRVDEALDAYRAAINLDPTHLAAVNNAGAILMNDRHDYAGAALLFEQGLGMEQLEWLAANLQKAEQGRAEQKR